MTETLQVYVPPRLRYDIVVVLLRTLCHGSNRVAFSKSRTSHPYLYSGISKLPVDRLDSSITVVSVNLASHGMGIICQFAFFSPVSTTSRILSLTTASLPALVIHVPITCLAELAHTLFPVDHEPESVALILCFKRRCCRDERHTCAPTWNGIKHAVNALQVIINSENRLLQGQA